MAVTSRVRRGRNSQPSYRRGRRATRRGGAAKRPGPAGEPVPAVGAVEVEGVGVSRRSDLLGGDKRGTGKPLPRMVNRGIRPGPEGKPPTATPPVQKGVQGVAPRYSGCAP